MKKVISSLIVMLSSSLSFAGQLTLICDGPPAGAYEQMEKAIQGVVPAYAEIFIVFQTKGPAVPPTMITFIDKVSGRYADRPQTLADVQSYSLNNQTLNIELKNQTLIEITDIKNCDDIETANPKSYFVNRGVERTSNCSCYNKPIEWRW